MQAEVAVSMLAAIGHWGARKGGDRQRALAQGIPWVFPTSLVPHHCPFSISTSKAWRKEGETKPPRVGFDSSYFQVSVLVFQSLHRAPIKKKASGEKGIHSVLRQTVVPHGLKTPLEVPPILH